jgi:hypothetical protein
VIAGYGMRPLRVLGTLIAVFLLSYGWFLFRVPPPVNLKQTLIFSAGALFTFGAQVDQLTKLSSLDSFVYVLTSFLGVSLLALFVTVTTNVLLSDD